MLGGMVRLSTGGLRNGQEVANFITDISPFYIVNLIGAFRAATFEDLVAINVRVSRSICDANLESKKSPSKRSF
jgi:hypothetical protein